MALKSYRLEQLKAARVQQEWPQAPDWVFEKLGVTREQLTVLEKALLGKIVLPGMPNYEVDSQSASNAKPLILVYCAVFNDVALCLQWAHDHNWWVTCRSGGHSTTGYCVNTGMVIDISGINYVSVDAPAKEARVGAGTRFQQLNSVLNTYKLHVPGGTCDDVGVAGFMQGGGYGFTSREYGMNCDSVLGVTVMLADGRLVRADNETNPDLYWAVRGGTGGNFGVLLEVRFRLRELYEVFGFCLQWSVEGIPAGLYALQQQFMQQGAPPQLGYLAVLTNLKDPAQPDEPAKPYMVMIGMYHGSHEEGVAALAPLMNEGQPKLIVDKMGTYNALNESLLDILPGPPLASGGGELKNCGYIDRPLELAEWEKVTQYFLHSPNPYNIVGIEPYGGAINNLPEDENAFVHRNVSMDLFVDSFWGEAINTTIEQAQTWLDGYMDVLKPCFNGHHYQNYPVRNYPDFRWGYWKDAFPSLLFIKEKYDPNNFFHFEQSISPCPPDDSTITCSTAPSRYKDRHIVYEHGSE